MLDRLPYRAQIPLGLCVAVLLAALLVTLVTAQLSARSARAATLATIDRATVLLAAQARPFLAADDTWRVFELLRHTAALLPGSELGHARAAVLDARGRVFAASSPERLETGGVLPGVVPDTSGSPDRVRLDRPDGTVVLLDAIRSDDGQHLGAVYIEVDAPVFAPDWRELSRPALIGVALAVAVLVPVGWWIGRRMTLPVARVAQVIERIGRIAPEQLREEIPRTRDPELGRISAAVDRLIGEMQERQQAEERALSAERMAAVGRLTAAVAHEINNPLGGLLNATQTLSLHGASEEARHRTLDLLRRGLHQIRATVAALLPQARVEDRPLELRDLDDVAMLAQPAAARRAAHLGTACEVQAPLRVPSAVMRQVMLNLLLNACKAAGDEGRVQASLSADADKVVFTVANSGERLNATDLERCIAAESGNDPRGFGLWVCREVATQYGGGFSVDEAFEAGTRLVFWMPNRERHEEAVVD
jgi:two-component system NtrC family sensor kinase